MLHNLNTMLITSKNRSRSNIGVVTFTFLDLCAFIYEEIADVLVSVLFCLPEPNVKELINNTYNHKTHIVYKFGLGDINPSLVISPYYFI